MGFFKDIKLNNQISNRLMILDDNKKIISTDISYTDIQTALTKTNQNESDISNININIENLSNIIDNNYTDLNNKISDLNLNLTEDVESITNNISNLSNLVNNNYTNLDNKITNLNLNISNSLNTINTNITTLEETFTDKINILSDSKVSKTEAANKVYGTDSNGNQTTYNKEDFGKVDTVNNKTADSNKNVQLDASDINLDDTDLNLITVKDKIANMDTTDTNINTKAEAAVKSVTFDNTTYTITFKDYNDNTIKAIDLPLESTVKSGRYDSINKKLILVLQSDDEIEIPVEDLVDVYTGVDGTKIKVTVDNQNQIKAEVKTGTIEKTDLVSSLQTNINSLITDNDQKFLTDQITLEMDNNKSKIKFQNRSSNYNTNMQTYSSSLLIISPTNNNDITINNSTYGINTPQIEIGVNAENVVFAPSTSGIASTKLSPAIRELKGLIDTNASDIADLVIAVAEAGKVDKVNNVTPDANKNVQLDASNINVDDSAQTITTVKACLTNILSRLDNLETTVNLMAQKITEINGEIV